MPPGVTPSRRATTTSTSSAGIGEVPDAVEERGRAQERLPPEERKPSASCRRIPTVDARRSLLEGRPHREQREERERVRHGVDGERDRRPDAVERRRRIEALRCRRSPSAPAARRPRPAARQAARTGARRADRSSRRRTRRPCPRRARSRARPRTPARPRPTTANVPSDSARRHVAAEHDPPRGQRSAATPATSPRSAARQETRERDEPAFAGECVRARAADTRSCERAAGGGEQLAGLEQDEVAVPAQRHPTPEPNVLVAELVNLVRGAERTFSWLNQVQASTLRR